MMLHTMIVRNGVIKINDQYPSSPRQIIRITKTTSSSFDALCLVDRSSSFTVAGLPFPHKLIVRSPSSPIIPGAGVSHLHVPLVASHVFVWRPDLVRLALIGFQCLTQRRKDPTLVFRPVETGFPQPDEKFGFA